LRLLLFFVRGKATLLEEGFFFTADEGCGTKAAAGRFKEDSAAAGRFKEDLAAAGRFMRFDSSFSFEDKPVFKAEMVCAGVGAGSEPVPVGARSPGTSPTFASLSLMANKDEDPFGSELFENNRSLGGSA
jgi:hypothetical protein